MPARYLVKYFEQAGEQWVARSELRAMCSFRQANLCTVPLPFRESFDVILLRNVMLYFSPEKRKSLLGEIRRLMASDGVLLLGSCEQAGDSPLWTAVLAGGTCYYRAAGIR